MQLNICDLNEMMMLRKMALTYFITAVMLFVQSSSGFSVISYDNIQSRRIGKLKQCRMVPHLKARKTNDSDEVSTSSISSRRKLFTSVFAGIAASGLLVPSSNIAGAADDNNNNNKIVWLTGKDPIVPGKKAREKGDVSGTKKDPKFLRSIADCKSQCENSAGPDGYARSKEDCFSDCQDICCTTYQQCTFAIVNRI